MTGKDEHSGKMGSNMHSVNKFKGKIRDNPLVALERGNREVMASLWKEYLAEVLGCFPGTERHRLLAERIEAAADFKSLYYNWDKMPPPERAQRWMDLVTATREELARCRDECIRCGECCEKSSPTLVREDLRLFQDNILDWTDVYTLRRGEKASSPRDQEVIELEEERIKIREHPKTTTCLFYATSPNRCLIYEDRPQQCRLQLCWLDEEERTAATGPFLSRRDLFGELPELWKLLDAHENRCAFRELSATLQALLAQEEEASKKLFEMLHFDHYLRQMLLREWKVQPAAVEFLLGRPLGQMLRHFGIKAEMTAEGVFRLEACRE